MRAHRQVKEHGTLLFAADSPMTSGALPAPVCEGAGVLVDYLPGFAMCSSVVLHPKEVKP